MSLYYNTGAPTPTTRNTINEVAVTYGIRDFLLNLNLLPQYPQISTSINGSPRIGEPVLDTSISPGTVLVPIGLPLETNGIIWKDLNVIYNTFQNDPSLANILEEIDYLPALSNPDFGPAIWPTNSQYPIGANSQIDQYGLKAKTEIAEYRKDNVIKNLYLDSTSQIDVADFITMFPLDISQQLGNYLDTFGGLNQGGAAGNQTINVIGSVLNGQGVGLGAGGSVIPNFDFKSSLAGRVLGAAGFVKDTKLGNVGAQQLALALANNAAFNVQQELLGALNVRENIYSLIKDGEVAEFRPNYKITVPSSLGGQILNGVTRVLGFQIPRSYLSEDGSLFQTENGDIANIQRANAMIENTGKGQVKSLLKSMLQNISVNSSGSTNPFRVGYAPAFNDKTGQPMSNAKIYAYYLTNGEGTVNGDVTKLLGNSGDIIPSISYLREQMTSDSGFKSPEELFVGVGNELNLGYNNRKISDVGFSWSSENGEAVNKVSGVSDFEILTGLDTNNIKGDVKSLLVKTQQLFNSKGMKTLVSVKGEMNNNSTQIKSANNDGISKGSAVLSEANYDLQTGRVAGPLSDADTTFCRSWTTLDRYDRLKDLIRDKPLYEDPIYPYRNKTQGSVLDGPFVKIAPYSNVTTTDPKKFMFSIENLAWSDNVKKLPECEVGPGDLITNKKGRIMWFPPYDLQFSENNTVNWEESNFIGRGEPVYTYNNTKRSGQLSFKIIVDHPSYYNAFRGEKGPDDNYIASFFAGCIDVDPRWTRVLNKSTFDEIVTGNADIVEPPKKVSLNDPVKPTTMAVYFPNDVIEITDKYENGLSGGTVNLTIDYTSNPRGEGYGLGRYKADITQENINGNTTEWPDRFNYGLNSFSMTPYNAPSTINGASIFGYKNPDYDEAMIAFLKECKYAVVEVSGYASPQGDPASNTELAKKRANEVVTELINRWAAGIGVSKEELAKRIYEKGSKPLTSTGCKVQSKSDPNPPTDMKECKLDRRAEINVNFNQQLKAEIEKALQPEPKILKRRDRVLTTEITSKIYTECDYFEKLMGDDNKFVFDDIRSKIKYFHPAFHSMTPEGLNSRLTFLLQCTRQGPTFGEYDVNNLAFGRPPICILRIGDFYHTKIVIENINIGYEPLVWDLNPEGVGVQPMIANVDISFNFIGGSALLGPINRLQNALSFNYFANTQVYDPRADYLSVKTTDNTTSENQTSTDPSTPNSTSNNVNLPSYQLNLGTEDVSNLVTKKQTESIRELNSQETDQVKSEENTNSGTENTPAPPNSTTTGTDEEVIRCVRIESYRELNDGDDTIQIGLGFYPPEDKPNLKFSLSGDKIFKGQLSLERLNTSNVNNINDFITARKNTETSVMFKGYEEYPIQSTSKSWVVEIQLTENDIDFLLKAKNDNSQERYSLGFKWNIQDAKSSVGYSSASVNK